MESLYGSVACKFLIQLFCHRYETPKRYNFFFVQSEGKAIGDDSYDVEKGFVDNTLWRKGVGRVGEGIDVTAIAIVVYEVLCSQSLTRKERLKVKVRLLEMILRIRG